MKIVLAGGGTGGHIMPLIAVARKIKEKNPDTSFLYIGSGGEMEKKLMLAENIPTKTIMSGKMRRYFSFLNFLDFFKIPLGIIQCLWQLYWNMPDAIFSKGGYVSFPVVIVGWLYRVPILIHESDAVPGMANSILSKFCERIAVSYPQAQKYFPDEQVVFTGSPLRDDIASGDSQKAKSLFGISGEKKVIFVWGGSQGSAAINFHIVEELPRLLKNYVIVHQTGEKNYEETKHMAGVLGIKAGREGYYPVPFVGEEIKDFLAMADLIISRAGATSIAEIAANGKPSILIPLENSANDHQRMNAYSVAKAGGAVVLEEGNLGENIFIKKIDEIFSNDDFRKKMSEKIKIFYHPKAAQRIAEGVLGMIE